MADPHILLRRLAEMESGDAPIMTVYLDMRPQVGGENPGSRQGLTILKDRLREIEKSLPVRGPELDSFREDVQQIEQYLDRDFGSDAAGLALFACAEQDFF